MMVTEYKGISFPFRIGGRGGVAMSGKTITGQQHLKEALQILLGTNEFERGMRPYYGLEDLGILFAELNETTKSMVAFKVTEKIQQFEPRVTVVSVNVQEELQIDGSRAYIIDVTYTETDTGNTETVAINF